MTWWCQQPHYQQSWYWSNFPGILHLKTLRPGQHISQFADDIFKCILLNENVWILITIWLKFVPKCPIDNNSALVQVMAWRRWAPSHYLNRWWSGLLTHICGLNELSLGRFKQSKLDSTVFYGTGTISPNWWWFVWDHLWFDLIIPQGPNL